MSHPVLLPSAMRTRRPQVASVMFQVFLASLYFCNYLPSVTFISATIIVQDLLLLSQQLDKDKTNK